MRKQCQAHVAATGTQCKKKAMLGSRYCHLHHSWRNTLFGSIALLIAGAVLKPAAQQVWNKYFPSVDSMAIRQLAVEKPSFGVYVNGVGIPTNCLVPMPEWGELTSFSNATNLVLHIPKTGELQIAISNTGKGAADRPMIHFYAPAHHTNTVVGNSWHPQPGFVGLEDGKLITNPRWLHWIHIAQFSVAPGTMFSASPIYLKRNAQETIVPVIVAVSSKETGQTRVAFLLSWE